MSRFLPYLQFFLLIVFSVLFGQTAVSPLAAQSPNPPLFENVTAAAGLANNRVGTEKTVGQAWGDVNNDGWPDLYVTDPNGRNSLYYNQRNGTFRRAGQMPEIELPNAESSGASFVDIDNDGWRDLYVLNWGENRLFRNEGGQLFVDITEEAGVAGDENSKTAAWGDFNQDGFVDLYIANWSCSPRCGRPNTGDKDQLYQNNGDGTFTNVTDWLPGSKKFGAGFVASFTDYDNDGDLDIYLVNDEFIYPVGNALWRNDGAGCDGWCFTEVSEAANADTRLMGMGLATADYDNDGDQDFYFSNAGPMTLLQNQGDGTFADVAEAVGVQSSDQIGWGATFFDYDNDGWQDLYLAVSEAAAPGGTAENPLFRNDQTGAFENVANVSGLNDGGETLGVATADFDRDGRLDLLVGNVDSGYQLYRNQSEAGGYFALDLIGGGGVNRDAIGSRVFVTTADGQTQMQEVICGTGLGAGNELSLHFGLGEQERIRELRIVWPDGMEQTFNNVTANRRLSLSYPADAEAEAAQQTAVYGDANRRGWETAVVTILTLAALALLIPPVVQRTRARSKT